MLVRKTTNHLVRAAFTLTEMLVVVAIIVVLAGIGGAILLPQLEHAKERTAKVKAKAIQDAAQNYFLIHDEYPPDINTLIQRDPENNNSAYLEPDGIVDPWGKPYTLSETGNRGDKPVVHTQAPSGKQIQVGGEN